MLAVFFARVVRASRMMILSATNTRNRERNGGASGNDTETIATIGEVELVPSACGNGKRPQGTKVEGLRKLGIPRTECEQPISRVSHVTAALQAVPSSSFKEKYKYSPIASKKLRAPRLHRVHASPSYFQPAGRCSIFIV